MELAIAKQLAEELRLRLLPYCERVEVAGGIRREKTDPHDIELVCIPEFSSTRTRETAFGPLVTRERVNRLHEFVKSSLVTGFLSPGEPDKRGAKAPCGPKYYRLKYAGEKLDLFAVIPPAQWGLIFTIRTGDAGFSHWLVQTGWPHGVKVVEGHLEKNGQELSTPDERDVFEALKVPWKDPRDRVTWAPATPKQWEEATSQVQRITERAV